MNRIAGRSDRRRLDPEDTSRPGPRRSRIRTTGRAGGMRKAPKRGGRSFGCVSTLRLPSPFLPYSHSKRSYFLFVLQLQLARKTRRKRQSLFNSHRQSRWLNVELEAILCPDGQTVKDERIFNVRFAVRLDRVDPCGCRGDVEPRCEVVAGPKA